MKFKANQYIFAAYDKAEMKKAKISIIMSSVYLKTSNSFLWPDIMILAAADLDWMQSLPMVISVQKKTKLTLLELSSQKITIIYTAEVF